MGVVEVGIVVVDGVAGVAIVWDIVGGITGGRTTLLASTTLRCLRAGKGRFEE
jgi:hypothetical protein